MDLSTSFVGLTLKTPVVLGSGPLDQTLDLARRCESAGAGMLIMHSLFEEQFAAEQVANHWSMEHGSGPDPLATMAIDDADTFILRPEEYYERLAQLKAALQIPVAGSINGISAGNWVMYAREIEEAGADAVELNIYDPVMNGSLSSRDVEGRLLEVVRLVRKAVEIPLIVKLSPFYTSVAYLARQLDAAGVNAIALFNRFYQPDINLDELKAYRTLRFSTSDELPLRLRWAAALSGTMKANLAITGGVHTGLDVLKAILAGADVVQVVSAVIQHGPKHLSTMHEQIETWMAERGESSLASLRGRLSLQNTPDRDIYDRANYVKLLRDEAHIPVESPVAPMS
jgi:dihydroorotate dehydrogenase (fumarate)